MPNTIRNNIRLTNDRIDEFLESKAKLKTETLAIYKRAIKDFQDWIPEPKELTKLAVIGYGHYLSTLYTKKASIRQRLSAISQLYKHFDISLDGKEVALLLEPVHNPVSLTEEEYEDLLSWAQTEGDILLYIALESIYTLDLSGDAVIEMITVENATRGSILMEEAGVLTEKYLIPSLAKTILAYAEEKNIQSGWVFASNRGRGRMDRGTLSKKLRRAATVLDLSPDISLSDVRRLGRQTAEEISAKAIYEAMEQRHNQLNTKEINAMAKRKRAPVPVLSKTTINSAIDELEVGEFLYECTCTPDVAMETWREANDITHKGWIHDYITESLRAQTPLIFPEAIDKVKKKKEYADIRRYIDLPIKTPGVEVFFQDGAYHIANPLESEWITSADGEEPDCSRIACRLVGNLIQAAGMFFFPDAHPFVGWTASLVPSAIVDFCNEDSLLVDENGIVKTIHPATGAEDMEKDLVWFCKYFCCHVQHKEKLEPRLCHKKTKHEP